MLEGSLGPLGRRLLAAGLPALGGSGLGGRGGGQGGEAGGAQEDGRQQPPPKRVIDSSKIPGQSRGYDMCECGGRQSFDASITLSNALSQ